MRIGRLTHTEDRGGQTLNLKEREKFPTESEVCLSTVDRIREKGFRNTGDDYGTFTKKSLVRIGAVRERVRRRRSERLRRSGNGRKGRRRREGLRDRLRERVRERLRERLRERGRRGMRRGRGGEVLNENCQETQCGSHSLPERNRHSLRRFGHRE